MRHKTTARAGLVAIGGGLFMVSEGVLWILMSWLILAQEWDQAVLCGVLLVLLGQRKTAKR